MAAKIKWYCLADAFQFEGFLCPFPKQTGHEVYIYLRKD
jgi:hypothetical protein